MGSFETFSDILSKHLQTLPPKRLFHYTSPDALIGIVSNKEIWATNTMFLNDANEIKQAADQAESVIEHIKDHEQLEDDELGLLNEFKRHLNSAGKRFYVASFTEHNDSLSQWRAYCPSSGGYNIGFPSLQIANMAQTQNFRLVKCIYDISIQWNILYQIIKYFVGMFSRLKNTEADLEEFVKDITWRFFQHIAKIGVIMKHPAFEEEAEWRVISSAINEINNPNIAFRGSHRGLIPYFKFRLVNDEFPNLVKSDDSSLVAFVGPSPDIYNRSAALQFCLSRYLGQGCGHGISQIPYKTW